MLSLDLKIRDIPEEGRDYRVPFPTDVLEEALANKDPDLARTRVEADIHVSRFNETVNISGRLRGDVKLACVRCLGEAHVAVDVPLRVVVGPQSLGAEDSLEDEVEYFTHDGEIVHLGEVLRESLILALPMTALCREECLGLCPVCGADRNATACGHDPRVPDPRFAVLKDVKL